MIVPRFPLVETCATTGREGHAVVANLDGTLLRGKKSFPYFALTAYDVGGPLRLLFLVLASPLAGLLYYFVSESAAIQVLIFATFAGVKVSSIESAAQAVLPKFYSEDIRPDSWEVFSSCGKKCVITSYPQVMVEAFLQDFLGADLVLGTEVLSYKGRATGFVKKPGVLLGNKKADALHKALGNKQPEIGLGDSYTDFPFMALCKEGYLVPQNAALVPVSQDQLPKPVIFHDGRLVQKPSPITALFILLWLPIGICLSILRVGICSLTPMPFLYYTCGALGIKITVKGSPPPAISVSSGDSGVLFVCSHRSVLDVLTISIALRRPISVLAYSVSKLTEFISPMKVVRLTRDRAKDASIIKKVLQEGDLFITPEGTTCREPFLLRFSALFAELTDEIVPVAIVNHVTMFHGTTARGWKGLDIFYILMNPSPSYEITFLSKVPRELTCSGGKSSHDVANYIQRIIASNLSYKCTNLTRKDKYRALAGNDGTVVEKSKAKEIVTC